MSRRTKDLKRPREGKPTAAVRLILAALLPTALAASAAAAVDYLRDLKPLLRERCYACHGSLKQKHDLRLDTVAAMLKGGKSGPAIQRGEPGRSLILERLTTTDLGERMPPEHEGEPLTSAQLQLVRDWIAGGAPAPPDERAEADPKNHWAFRECVRPPLPVAANRRWVKNPIDAFIASQHAQHGLTPQVEAPREVLLRRLYLDLIGLPPTPAEITAVMQDRSDRWYEDTVQRLLADPRHGERWARHWMDIWRYSDWWGLGEQLRNSQKHIWHWRDWIVDSLNADLPYDEMVRLMLAADDPISQADFYRMRAFFEPYHVRLDVLPGEPDLERDGIPRAFDGLLDLPTYRFVRGQENQPDKSAIIAPGVPDFLALGELHLNPVALPIGAWQPERRPWVLDAHLVAARKKLEAAEAPIPKLQQALASALRCEADLLVPGEPGNASLPAPASNRPSLQNARSAVEQARDALSVAESTLVLAQANFAAVEGQAEAMRASWASADADSEAPAQAEATRAARVAAVKAERAAAVAKARQVLADARLRLEKAADDAKESVAKEVRLAREGLENAMKTAEAPVKPDESYTPLAGAKWTPTRFLNSGTDDPLVKFPPQSSGRRRALASWITDRRNPLTARVAANHIWMRHLGTPLVSAVFDFGRKGTPPTHPGLLDWLATELMESGWSMKHLHRLIVTSSTYRMSSSLAGGEANAAKDPDNLQLWRRGPIRLEAEVVRDSLLSLAGTLDFTRGGPPVPPANQDDSKRRSLYFYHSNNDRNLFLATFDEAAVKECYRRDQSIVPQQALALTNSRLVHDAAGRIAARLSRADSLNHGQPDEVAFIRQAFAVVLGISAGDAEIAASRKALENWGRPQVDGGTSDPRALLIWALLNHNDFVTLR